MYVRNPQPPSSRWDKNAAAPHHIESLGKTVQIADGGTAELRWEWANVSEVSGCSGVEERQAWAVGVGSFPFPMCMQRRALEARYAWRNTSLRRYLGALEDPPAMFGRR